MTLPDWIVNARKWDTAILGGVELPGLTWVDDTDLSATWDERESDGTTGATLTFKGWRNVPFSLRLKFWTQEQWLAWQTLIASFVPIPSKGKPAAFPISHPLLAAYKISACIVLRVRPSIQEDSKVMITRIECKSWYVPPKEIVGGTPTDTVNAGVGGPTQAQIAIALAYHSILAPQAFDPLKR